MAYQLSAAPLDQAVPSLVRQAAIAGGKNGDNVTALAVTWLDELRDPGRELLTTDGLPQHQVITSIHPARR